MKFLSYTFETQLKFDKAVSNHSFLLRCQPKTTPRQTVMESQVILTPHVATVNQVDGFGNSLKVGYLSNPHKSFTFMSYGLVMVDENVSAVEAAHPMFLQSSAYTMPNDAMVAFVKQAFIDAFGPSYDSLDVSSWEKAQILMNSVANSFEYIKGVTGVHTTAAESFALKQGVCQDFAQVLITLCRIANIPARYCAGLMMGEGETHAWVEIYDGKNWRGLDPANNRVVTEEYVLFSFGRDFEDCSIERGVFLGNANQKQFVIANVAEEGANS